MKSFLLRAISVILMAIFVIGAAPLANLVGLKLPDWNLPERYKSALLTASDRIEAFGDKASAATYSGTCGTKMTWSFDTSTGELKITGTGEMSSWDLFSNAPWYSYRASIKTVSIANGVKSIGDYAFCYCTGLTSVTVPDSVTSIGTKAFENTPWYNSQPDGVIYIVNIAYGYKGNMPENTVVVIKSGIKYIENYAFNNCRSLTCITIPDSVTDIGNGAFSGCTGLTSVSIGCNSKLTSIGELAFSNCCLLSEITIPGGVTKIRDETFSGCSRFTNIIIPNGLTAIGFKAFANCDKLTNAVIPDTVTYIDNSAFDNCPTFTAIYGNINSYAQQYALARRYDFISSKEKYADIDSDGKVTAADARLTLRAAVGLDKLNDTEKSAADLDFDGKVTAADARLVLRVAVKLDSLEELVKAKKK